MVELEVPYRPRIAGTASKLRAFRRRPPNSHPRSSCRASDSRPWRPLTALAVPIALVGLAIGSWTVVLVAATLLVAAVVAGVGLLLPDLEKRVVPSLVIRERFPTPRFLTPFFPVTPFFPRIIAEFEKNLAVS